MYRIFIIIRHIKFFFFFLGSGTNERTNKTCCCHLPESFSPRYKALRHICRWCTRPCCSTQKRERRKKKKKHFFDLQVGVSTTERNMKLLAWRTDGADGECAKAVGARGCGCHQRSTALKAAVMFVVLNVVGKFDTLDSQ
jgi:hypothetical protein